MQSKTSCSIKHICIEEPESGVALLFKEHEIRNNQCMIGRKLEEYIKSQFPDASDIEIDIPNIKVTETDEDGTFVYGCKFAVITESRHRITQSEDVKGG